MPDCQIGVWTQSLKVLRTKRFSVFSKEAPTAVDQSKGTTNVVPPVVSLNDLLLHSHRGKTNHVKDELRQALKEKGFCLLTYSRESTAFRVIQQLKTSLDVTIFPQEQGPSKRNTATLEASDSIYFSEKGVPMYHLGYELCEDRVREVFRIAAGRPDDVTFPDRDTREIWLRALGLMRHICDIGLALLLADSDQDSRMRPYSSSSSWMQDRYATSDVHSLKEREGDFSVLYAMHYFNDETVPPLEDDIAVKAHVDPSLLVLEPFLCTETRGLQIWDRQNDIWMDCDGPDSSLTYWQNASQDDNEVMVLFVGKALLNKSPFLDEATLHRVLIGDCSRRTVIYEQKYEEHFPPPLFD